MGRRALVTGGSRGIGAAIARRLAADGHHVVVNYRSNAEAADAVVAGIVEAGGSAEAVGFDVRDGEAVANAMAALDLEANPFAILVNNAGISKDGPLAGMTDAAWTDVTRTTLDGFFHVTRACFLPMIRLRWGRIVNISSVSGVVGNRGQVNYIAAKAGLIGATRSLSLEAAKRNVTVNAVAPGLIETDMLEGMPLDRIVPTIPMRRLGRADEVAELVGFLCSDAAGYITGQVIGINGGLAG
jgi:3-oxoacyl-[acyl-carrier protein] reductase